MAEFSFPVLVSPVKAKRKETSTSREHTIVTIYIINSMMYFKLHNDDMES